MNVQAHMSYEDKPIQILDREERTLRNRVIPLVKVLWKNHDVEEAMWERKDDMRKQHPKLFWRMGEL